MDRFDGKPRITPAICTQCSAQIEVDASADAAICSHCGTAFVVEKAIAQFNVQKMSNAHIGHVETLNIHHSGEDKKAKGIFGRNLDTWAQVQLEREKRKAEAARLKAEQEKQILKYLPIMIIASVIMLVAMMLLGK